MFNIIKKIINEAGPREAGSEAEVKGQEIVQSELNKFCNNTETHIFKTPLSSHFGSLKIFCLFFYISLFLYSYSLTIAVILSIVNFIFFMGHFVGYRHWLDFIFKKDTSLNVIGNLEPKKEVKSTLT